MPEIAACIKERLSLSSRAHTSQSLVLVQPISESWEAEVHLLFILPARAGGKNTVLMVWEIRGHFAKLAFFAAHILYDNNVGPLGASFAKLMSILYAMLLYLSMII
jgi:hypothetical protein